MDVLDVPFSAALDLGVPPREAGVLQDFACTAVAGTRQCCAFPCVFLTRVGGGPERWDRD